MAARLTPEEQKAHVRAYRRERRDWYLSHGMCPYCGQRDVTPGYKSCEPCRLRRGTAEAARWAAYVETMGGKERANAERRRRLDHDRVRAYGRGRYHQRRAAGLCTRCGKASRPGMALCEACAKLATARTMAYLARRKEKLKGD